MRLRRADDSLLAFIATGAGGTGLKFNMYDGTGWTGVVSISETGDIYSNGKKVATAIDYSTAEQDTGRKWIDGKTVYVKTVEYDRGTVANHFFTFSSDADRLISYQLYLRNAATDTASFLSLPYIGVNFNEIAATYRNSQTTVVTQVGTTYRSAYRYAFGEFYYTKV